MGGSGPEKGKRGPGRRAFRGETPPMAVAGWWRSQAEGRARAPRSLFSSRARPLVGVSGRLARVAGPERRRGGGGARPRNARGAVGADRTEPVRGRNGVPGVRVEQGSGARPR